MHIRPTSLGLALLNAAVKHQSNGVAQVVINTLGKNDRPNAPLQSGYNRVERDNLRLSARTLASMR